jgi:CxxC motif-containing protein
MNKNMVCFICPKSCLLSVSGENGTDPIRVENNGCTRGIEFAQKEINDPERTLTSTVKVRGGVLSLVSVRSDGFVKKAELLRLVKQLDSLVLEAPVSIGQVVMPSAGTNKVHIIATRGVEKELEHV